eukprot:CAMPEP_0198278312 /NCGR_PEP_ID=MMETSP1447-20131203/66311_1 /TAXON_ID=420782 /ORGANISM="Chaetoceros dichaeta, Strain CCMP1751" /LENGTH=108 /DNA_ID=CAMNT_0043973389 /DNA_START=85 /DNA_END=411 /DNA_ORIENTATION=-
MSHTQSSITGAYECRIRAFAQKEAGDYISALISFRRVLKIREHHVGTPPFSNEWNVGNAHNDIADVLNAHNDVADVLDDIVIRLNSANEPLVQKYTAEAADHRSLGRN